MRVLIRVQLRSGPPASALIGASTTLSHIVVDVANLERLSSEGLRAEVPINQTTLPFRLVLSTDARKLLDRVTTRGTQQSPPAQPLGFSFVVYPTLQHIPSSTFNLSSPFCILVSKEVYAKIRHNLPSFLIECRCEYWGNRDEEMQSYRQLQAQSCLPVL